MLTVFLTERMKPRHDTGRIRMEQTGDYLRSSEFLRSRLNVIYCSVRFTLAGGILRNPDRTRTRTRTRRKPGLQENPDSDSKKIRTRL